MLSLRIFTSSDPMRRDNRRILPQSEDDRRLIEHARRSKAEREQRAPVTAT
jgi:hypothetical protein